MAARKPHLRAVPEGSTAPTRKKHTVATAARDGDRLDLLYAVRDRIAKAVTAEDCPPRDLAALTRRLDDVVEKIAVLEAAEKAEAEEAADGELDDEAFDASAL